MASTRFFVTATLAMVVAACTPSGSFGSGAEGSELLARQELSPDAGAPPCPTDGGTCVSVSPTTVLDAACSTDRWIAVLRDGNAGCPDGPHGSRGGWAGSLLFASSTGTWTLPPGLSSFCAYDWVPAGSALPWNQDVDMLKAVLASSVARLDPECQVVAPLGSSATTEAAWPTLHEDFHAQTGQLASLPVGANLPPAEVRVAVVDSAPHVYSDGEAVEDRLGHGYAMGRVIRELGCPDGSPACIAQVANHLALPQVTPRVKDTAHGGYFGEQTQLARSIHAAVSDWRSHNAGMIPPGESTTPQPRLVINLSLAWDGRYGGPYSGSQVEQLPAPVQAVHAAITHAVCRGALLIAAAGNDPGGPEEVHGPMYPAGWEQKSAPGPTECGAREGAGYPEPSPYRLFPPSGVSVYRPLVYAVGGVRGDDQPLGSTRPEGRPRLVAPGAHAVAADADSTGTLVPTDILTGTSVSTAVLSGTASTVWGYRPELSGPEVMELVRQAAVDLSVPADFCLGGAPCPWGFMDPRRSIRRASLCRSLAVACMGGPSRCPGAVPACPSPRPAYGSPLPRLDTTEMGAIESKLTRTVDGSVLDVELPPVAVCRHDALRSISWSYDDSVCPFRQYYGLTLQPWTNPQPSKNPCTLCLVQVDETVLASPSATLYISIDSEYSRRSLFSPTLLLNGKYEIDLSKLLELDGEPTLEAGDEIKVADIPLDPSWLPIETAALTMEGDEAGIAYSTYSELLVQ